MRFSSSSFDATLFGDMIHVESASVTITDDSAVAKSRGIPDGYTHGGVGCDVELELDLMNFRKAQKAARSAGSWRGVKPEDMLFYANNGEDEDKVQLFGVKFLISDLLSIDPNSADKTKRKLKGFVTSPNFVRINDIPYLSSADTRGLV